MKFIFIFIWRASMIRSCFFAVICSAASALVLSASVEARAQERPFFITYDHALEEPGNLEIALNPTFGTQRGGGSFVSSWAELEYGATAWWTTAAYLNGQTTRHDSTVFTGFRWENRFRPLMVEHRVNPVLYLELERLSEADKTLLPVVGHDVEAEHAEPNEETSLERETELEARLILSSRVKGWTVAENLVVERNLEGGPWEFGYSFGVSRPMALAASPRHCSACRENFVAGIEVFGGLGDTRSFGLTKTAHYLAPVFAWELPGAVTLRVSPTFGLNGDSHRFLLRLGAAVEIPRLGRR
jgi:hypothetical protein